MSDINTQELQAVLFMNSGVEKQLIVLPQPRSLEEITFIGNLPTLDSFPAVLTSEKRLMLQAPCQSQNNTEDCGEVNRSFSQNFSDEKNFKNAIFQKSNLDEGRGTIEQSKVPELKLKSTRSSHSDSHDSFKKTSTPLERISSDVIPKWNQYLALKNRRKEADPTTKRRADTYKKKVLRDLREFYRILFRKRFHLSEYKTPAGIRACIQTFFDELGITVPSSSLEDYQLFRFLHQTHQCTSSKLVSKEVQKRESPFIAVEKYNDTRYSRFLTDPLCSQLFQFVFTNFLNEYTPFVKYNIRKRIVSIIHEVLGSYTE